MSWQIWAVIGGMALTNFVLRLLPIALLSRLNVPRPVERWLSYVPVSVMAAFVANEVMRPGAEWVVPWSNPYLLAAIPTAFVYHRTRSLFGATVAGVLAFLAVRWLLAFTFPLV
jgi:branched-subunit amino acid transport protein